MFSWLSEVANAISGAVVSLLLVIGFSPNQLPIPSSQVVSNVDVQVAASTTDNQIVALRDELESQIDELRRLQAQISSSKNNDGGNNKLNNASPTTNKKTFTTPSGAVLDEDGNVISGPTKTVPSSPPASVSAGVRVLSGEEIYSLISPSVVQIAWSEGDNSYAGSGFVIENGKYTVTNAHVLRSNAGVLTSKVNIRLSNGSSFVGYVLGANDSIDIGAIYNDVTTVPPVKLGTTGDSLKVGSDVYALGYPEAFSGLSAVTFTRGALSAKSQTVKGYSGTFLQMDAAINHGNSGGPLVSSRGEVVGVNTASLTGTQGIYFAVPIDVVQAWIPSLTQNGQSRYEVHPIGSTIDIKESILLPIQLNPDLSCASLGFKNDDLNICQYFRSYPSDYIWHTLKGQ